VIVLYRAVFTSKAEKQLKKLTKKNKPLVNEFEKQIKKICKNPKIGYVKLGDLNGVWGYGFIKNRTSYRIAYIISNDELIIFIIGVGTRENFWRDLKQFKK